MSKKLRSHSVRLINVLFFLISSISFSQTVSSIEVDNPSLDENGGVALITATISEAHTKKVTIPVTISGTATAASDYSSSFASLGQEELIIYTGTSGRAYSDFEILEDGRYVFRRYSSQLKVIDPEAGTTNTVNLANSNNLIKTDGNTIYSQNSSQISTITIGMAGNIISEEIIVAPGLNQSISGEWAVNESTIYYQTYHSITGITRLYSQEGNNNPVLLKVGEYYEQLFYYSGKLYAFDGGRIYEYSYSLGDFSEFASNISYLYDLKKINNKLYIKTNENGTDTYTVSLMGVSNNNVSFLALKYTFGETINKMVEYSVDASGNLLLYNQEAEGSYGVFKYQQEPQPKILAGKLEGTHTLTSLDDLTDEVNETIEVTLGAPTTATIVDFSTITLTIEDNDTAPEVTFAFSSESIDEYSSNTVTLTATPSEVSGSDITIPFTLSGTADKTEEYTVSGSGLLILTGSTSTSVTISTEGLDDNAVEVLKTIIFTFETQ